MFTRRVFFYVIIGLFTSIGVAYYSKENKIKTVAKIETVQMTEQEEAVKKSVFNPDEKNQIRRFFSRGVDRFPIVETITYTSRVPWLKGRPAWIADYASFYGTSRHFIARGLNGSEDYASQNVSPGDMFNILRNDKEIAFNLKVDLDTCIMEFSYQDNTSDEKVFIKNYQVGVGRKDAYSPSGSLTPLGKYKLGEKIAIYKKGVENYFQNRKTHMIEVFGTRWIPFGEEVENCTDSAKGYGIHGLPFVYDEAKDEYIENMTCLGQYSSDGCIRLKEKDINEIFAIVITRPTYIEIVKGDSVAVNKQIAQ